MTSVIERLEAARSPDRLCPILTDPYHDFYAGRTADSRQLLAGEWCPDVVVGLFDDRGNLLQTEHRTIGSQSEVEERLREWYGYTRGLVRLKWFSIPLGHIQTRFPAQWAEVGEPQFAIAPFPFDWEECYGDLADFPADDPDYVAMVRGWIDRGNFAMFWGTEIHLDGSGQVVGT
jgi:hypothetical protein